MKEERRMARLRSWFSPLNAVFFTQFMSSFADNLNFFLILGMVTRRGVAHPETYITNIQIGFLLAFVVLAPLVGAYADKKAKARVLLTGNAYKAVAIALLLFGVHPVICYSILGIGSVIYSPAKYGILTELTDSEPALLRANASLEGSAILAILLGTVAGGLLADISDLAGLVACLLVYGVSIAFTLLIPVRPGKPDVRYGASAREFFRDVGRLLANPKARFSLVSTSAFWLTASVLRIALVAWIPYNLGITGKTEQSMIIGVTAVGVVLSAFLTPRLVPAGKLFLSYRYGYAMVAVVMLTAFLHSLWLSVALLLLVGVCGGVYLIPMNTILQEEGKALIGSGKTIAIQNFIENGLTVIGLGLFTLLAASPLTIDADIILIGLVLLLFLAYTSTQVGRVRRLPAEAAGREARKGASLG
jgi:LPLT family lysophospholipid transporter-like MFS transporter